ncbi:hypothetical protein [Flavobacterium sp. FlaQc-50]|uniref:hypothetical protein n=1 Tax=unclassified Flavobacterium TaxID=196869 RepID=UPI003757B60B
MNKIEIIIDKEHNGNDVSLSGLSVNTTNALIEILSALRNIAVHEGKPDIKIGLVEGSACAVLEGEQETMEVIHRSIMKVVDNDPNRENFYVDNLQVIKEQINERGFEVKVRYLKNGDQTSLREAFNVPFRKKRIRTNIENNFNIEFFHGKLQSNGGDNPNFHIISDFNKYVISCTERQAQIVNQFLYKEFRFSAWAKMGPNNKMLYQYCDIYESNQRDFYNEFRRFFSELKRLEGTAAIKKIHYKLKEFYSNNEFAEARKFIRIFLNDTVEVSTLMAILIISKRFKNHPELEELLGQVEELIMSKTKKPVL